ncbi:hypothetical protein POSPLADRAFT_1133027 [Postia placenta MAD-698-R-SB12]|uniref:F-box domain-containing protein n=1 Tax=Postia placenta MAD-698-R-SB12 TaxID=670580 RepID=A0A1X6NAS0_9APHY|nr:hypothetical protein POSPLADRAFT_1133027 [Postia placenta MAD-698-R-SB12]OSX65701.1 hypothetical protein POSPLADRAFT_1133027 [Postia placenta MAD-698-R-SB12]
MSVALIFDSTTADIVSTTILLPVEIWLQIIDELCAEHEYDALHACAYASEGLLRRRAERAIPEEMTFRTQEEVARIKVRQHWEGPWHVRTEGGRRRGERLPIPHLATLASRLAQKWTNVQQLTIERAEWRAQGLDLPTLLLDLGCLSQICHLNLDDVTFPSALTFWRLVCTLPHLRWLYLRDVTFVKTAIGGRAFSAFRLLSATNLEHVWLWSDRRPGSRATDSAGLLQVISAQPVLSLRAPPWSKVWSLELWDVTLPTAAAFARLLYALPDLQLLVIHGPCTFSDHGFTPTDVPPHPGMPSGFRTIELGKNFSLCSDPQSVHDLVDILIRSGASRRLEKITAWLSPSLRVPTSIDVALNRLVKHAGQSLKWLELMALPQENLPLFYEASAYAAPSIANCFDVLANTHLSYLLCSVEITREGSSSISPLLDLLHQITLTISHHMELRLRLTDDADLATLWADLPYLDAALTQTSFDKLAGVWITFHPANESTSIPRAMVSSCLPQLDARSLLGCVPFLRPHCGSDGCVLSIALM